MEEIFISWAGEKSEAVAKALRSWLKDVFQGSTVWMSSHNIQAGERWGAKLSEQLENSDFGIVCLTPDNLESPWIIFEAGALSKKFSESESRVVPYRFALKATEIGPPISQFQSVDANEQGTLKLVSSINKTRSEPLSEDSLVKTFAKWWPDLESSLDEIERKRFPERRSERELLEEILDLVRRTGSREINDILVRILEQPNVHSIRVAQKLKGLKSAGTASFRILVNKKLPLAQIPEDERIPNMIYGIPTDVRELKKN